MSPHNEQVIRARAIQLVRARIESDAKRRVLTAGVLGAIAGAAIAAGLAFLTIS